MKAENLPSTRIMPLGAGGGLKGITAFNKDHAPSGAGSGLRGEPSPLTKIILLPEHTSAK